MNWNLLWTKMDRHIPTYIIDRGIEYYEQGLVEELEIKAPWIRATVLGNYGNYIVDVHVTDFEKSRCDCPYGDYCKHMAAVVYYVLREYPEQSDDAEIASDSSAKSQKSIASVEVNTEHLANHQIDIELDKRLKGLGKNELHGVLKQLMEIVPSLREMLRLILVERERAEVLNSDEVRHLQLYSSLTHYQKEITVILKECEELFVIREASSEEDDEWDDGYGYDEEEQTEWDFEDGMERLLRFGQELLKQVTPSHYISGTIGLLTTVVGLEEWIDRYDDEYSGSELTDGCLEFEGLLWEALERVKTYQIQDPTVQTFICELIEWIVHQCKVLDDLLAWTTILTHCTVDLRSFWHLKDRIVRLDKDFLRSDKLDNERHRAILVRWWIELSLSLNLETEAKETAQILNGSPLFDTSIATCFVEYYEQQERWREAITALKVILVGTPHINQNEYEWIIRLCERSGDEDGKKDWLEKWFLNYPDFNLFKRNVAMHESDSDLESKISYWIDYMRKQKQVRLVINIYLFQGNLNQAWAEFILHKDQFQLNEPLLLKLFNEMKKQDPSNLIPIYCDSIIKNINYRNRSAYALAARWMKDLKEACLLSKKEEQWTAFNREIMTQYKRFRSLMEEIRAVGID
ncbi:MAG: SWIM zinc finger family protein [Bacilli bacterium]